MYPEDRILVGVINRKRDFEKVQAEGWYRIPQGRFPKGIQTEYVAFFFSQAFKELNGGIHFYAPFQGVELVYRRDLLPEEASHPRANELYYKVQLGELRRRETAILNPTRRSVAFIYTTWDRFEQAATLADLYSEADQFVDRVFHALDRSHIQVERVWEAERDGGAGLRIECKKGTILASTTPHHDQVIPLHVSDAVPISVTTILAAIEASGGPLMISVPIEE
ncbi:MAG TPA: hypothetical protein VHP83_24530 [Aggregatilineaceae bacterium]|nr:hypothetical protein [Aggregatilineaceae bacterium]